MSNALVIDTPDGIAHFQMARLIAALSIEVNTGMKMGRGSVMKAAKQQFGLKKNTKAGVLAELKALYKSTYGWEYGEKR